MNNLTQQRLKELVFYCPKQGNFYRLKKVSNLKLGIVVAKPSKNGYLRMHIDGRLYYMHRLAWLYMHGSFPAYIDHVDGNRQNNKLENLNDVKASENFQNVAKKSIAQSGLKGAYFDKKSKLWQSKIRASGKNISLGYYKTAELAHQAYLDGKKKYHTYCPEFLR
jgi:hypothetical protein